MDAAGLYLVMRVHFHEGRYHGNGTWPPEPARFYQALVAGLGLGGPLPEGDRRILEWMEGLEPPLLGAPVPLRGERVTFYVPNNDLDSVSGDSDQMAGIRAAKVVHPTLFDQEIPFLYAWSLEAQERSYAQEVLGIAQRLYQLGRGWDGAWAEGEIMERMESFLDGYPGRVYKPSRVGEGAGFTCPQVGTLASLCERFEAMGKRFSRESAGTVFAQPMRPRFRTVYYDSPAFRRVYELRGPEGDFASWPLTRTSDLVLCARERSLERLKRAFPERAQEIERVLVGQKPDGSNAGPTEARVKIIPLPSIGHQHADLAIRRVLIEVPTSCPLAFADMDWAFSGLELAGQEEGRNFHATLTGTSDDGMAGHYGIGADGKKTFGVWRTVTPLALPLSAARRRIEPKRRREEAKGGAELQGEMERAAGAVVNALRHAGIRSHPQAIRLQREPFTAKGARAEAFAYGARFTKERLWHVEIAFDAAIRGPVLLGDGRFCGLGLMAPVQGTSGGVASGPGSNQSVGTP